MNNEKMTEQIGERLAVKETPELCEIWVDNNRAQWSDQAFAAIELILRERGVALPVQREPHYQALHPEGDIAQSKNKIMSVGGWTLYGSFLVWVLLLAPLNELGHVMTPLTMSEEFFLSIWMGIHDIETFQRLVMGMVDVKFLLTCFGMITGVLLLIENQKAIVCAKGYLLSMTLWTALFIGLINVYPFAEIYWQNQNSVMGLQGNWESILSGYAVKPGWELLTFTSKKFWPVFICALVWFLFFQRSQWVKGRFGAKETTQNTVQSRGQ